MSKRLPITAVATHKMRFLLLFLTLASFTCADSVNGWNALHEAAYENNLSKAKDIVASHTFSIDAQSRAGISPLHVAVKNRNFEMIEMFLENGADIDIQDRNGLTPLHYAIGQKLTDIVKYLVKRGADIHLANEYGITPLHQAAYSGRIEVVEFLMISGADPLVKNAQGATPYDLAKAKGRLDVASYLESYNIGENNDSNHSQR